MNKIRQYFANREAKRFGEKYNKAVKNLTGGLEYSTIDFKKKILKEINRGEDSKKNEIITYTIGGIIGAIIGFIIEFIFEYLISLF